MSNKKSDNSNNTSESTEITAETTDGQTSQLTSELESATYEFEGLQENYKMSIHADSTDVDIHYVVGIGASAGGLEALQHMVANLPTDTGMSFVIAQHLSPSHKSMMVDLLEKDSTIPVVPAKHQASLEPNTIYICPPQLQY